MTKTPIVTTPTYQMVSAIAQGMKVDGFSVVTTAFVSPIVDVTLKAIQAGLNRDNNLELPKGLNLGREVKEVDLAIPQITIDASDKTKDIFRS